MKKFLSLLLVVCMLLPVVAMAQTVSPSAEAIALPEVKLGQVQWAAHGTKCFAVITVALCGDVIVAALIDEYQIGAGMVGVPNSENGFGGWEDGKVLYSKRVNAEAYSASMASKGGSTVALDVNYDLIQAYCVGKTVAELEAAINGFADAQAAVDAVSGATLVDTLGYLQGILAAAKAAQ